MNSVWENPVAMMRNILWLLTIAVMMYGCKEAQPTGPGAGDVVVYEVKTDVNPDRVFLVRGTNLYVLSDVGSVVCYGQGHGDIRIPMKIVFGETSFSCILPDSVRSGRVRIIDGSGKAIVDTVLRIYGDHNNELAGLPVDLVWNQNIQVKGSMIPVLVDQNMRHHALSAHPAKPGTWLVPHQAGSFRWVAYDARTGYYHAARTLVRIPRPSIGIVPVGGTDVITVNDYVPLEGERVKLISMSHTYERDVHPYANSAIVSMIGMGIGHYRAQVADEKLDGEIAIDEFSGEDHELMSTKVEINGYHLVGLRTITITTEAGETRIDTSQGNENMKFSCAIERCTLERISRNVFQIHGQARAEGSVSLYGTIVREGNVLSTDLTFTEGGPEEMYARQHRIKLRQRSCTTDPEGFVEVVIDGEDFVRTGEYYYSGRETISTSTSRQERTMRMIGSDRQWGSLVLSIRM